MELIFLGTGGAWGLPEHACPCATCRHLRAIGQYRTRTSLWLEGPARVLIDPGPDLRAQLMREDLPRPDAVLITHEHGDHFLGLDDLLCFRLEKRLAVPGEDLEGEPFGPGLGCRPVKTDHGPMPKGSVGYRLELAQGERTVRLGYTGDLVATRDPDAFCGLDLLVCQCHFLNEPRENRPNHLSLQRALPLLERWRPGAVYFVHLSCQDLIPGDEPANRMLKKYPPARPLRAPDGEPYPIPRDQASWQAVVERVLADQGLELSARVAWDGLRVRLQP